MTSKVQAVQHCRFSGAARALVTTRVRVQVSKTVKIVRKYTTQGWEAKVKDLNLLLAKAVILLGKEMRHQISFLGMRMSSHATMGSKVGDLEVSLMSRQTQGLKA